VTRPVSAIAPILVQYSQDSIPFMTGFAMVGFISTFKLEEND
jgi:hypothetical protein